MGFRISWIAFEGLDRARCLDLVCMTDTDHLDEANEEPFSMASLPTGWTVLFSNDFEYVSHQKLALLSDTCRIVGCRIDENVMYSSASAFENGKLIWSLAHNSSEGHEHLETARQLPDEFDEIRTRLSSQQDVEDYIADIPLVIAAKCTGYRHDQWKFDWGVPAFMRVLPGTGAKPHWFKRLLGRTA
jgi:hypothetical protein